MLQWDTAHHHLPSSPHLKTTVYCLFIRFEATESGVSHAGGPGHKGNMLIGLVLERSEKMTRVVPSHERLVDLL